MCWLYGHITFFLKHDLVFQTEGHINKKKINYDCVTRCLEKLWWTFLLQTTFVIYSVTRIWQYSICFTYQYSLLQFIYPPGKINGVNQAVLRNKARFCVKFSYLTDPFHDSIDGHIAGGREWMRTDKKSTQVTNILHWKGWRFPWRIAGSNSTNKSHRNMSICGSYRIISSSKDDLNKTGWIKGQEQEGHSEQRHLKYLSVCFLCKRTRSLVWSRTEKMSW